MCSFISDILWVCQIMTEVLSISNYEIAHNETYHEFYTRLIKQQMDNLLSSGSKVSGRSNIIRKGTNKLCTDEQNEV